MTEPTFQILPYPTEDAPGVPLENRRLGHRCLVCREHTTEPLVCSKYPNQGINFVCRPCLKAALDALSVAIDGPLYAYDPDTGEVTPAPNGRRQRDPKHDQQTPCARTGCGDPYERHFDWGWGDLEVGCKYCECSKFVEPKP